jgi:FkbM family methyltransferase
MKIRPSDSSEWYKAKGDDTFRLNYPLNKDSIVIDLGGALGDWSMPIYNLYKPNIYIFEPTDLFAKLEARFEGLSKVHLLNFAASNEDAELALGVMDGEASLFHEENLVTVQATDFGAFLDRLSVQNIDLLKMNIEGAEYEILEGIVSRGQLNRFVNIQCQFHMIDNHEERYKNLIMELEKTHYLTWRFPFVWENWTRKGEKPPRMTVVARFRKSIQNSISAVARGLRRVEGFVYQLVRQFFSAFGLSLFRPRDFTLISHEDLSGLNRSAAVERLRLEALLQESSFYSDFNKDFIKNMHTLSKSQLGQDLLALGVFGPSHKGFFVEFGATDGIDLSNTWLLESKFGWKGILCEPGRNWHRSLRANRRSEIDTRVVYSASGLQVDFLEAEFPELSTIKGFGESDQHSSMRMNNSSYKVETISLLDLLREHSAPSFIEFLSVDTEGSEFEILRNFNFNEYRFGLICVEHNYTENRIKVEALLSNNGYKRIYPEFSAFDAWFIPVNS